MLVRFVSWAKNFFHKILSQENKSAVNLPPITFQGILVVQQPPKNPEVQLGAFYLVSPNNQPKWAIFRCPCGCDQVITLSLQKVHQPHWSLRTERDGSPSLYPSIWQRVGCCSHFWLREGRIFWCDGTGSPPLSSDKLSSYS